MLSIFLRLKQGLNWNFQLQVCFLDSAAESCIQLMFTLSFTSTKNTPLLLFIYNILSAVSSVTKKHDGYILTSNTSIL